MKLFLSLSLSLFFLSPSLALAPSRLGRRAMLASALSTAASPASARPDTAREDPYAHSSFFGLAPPPLSGQWSREQLLQEARAGNVATMQIAPQHDCVFAVSTIGYRYACLIPDAEFQSLLLDAMGTDGTYPFEVIPLDENRAAVRSAAGTLLQLSGAVWVANFFGLLPWDLTSYGSIAERNKAAQSGHPRPKPYEAVLPAVRQLMRRVRPSLDRSSPSADISAHGPDSAEGLQDDALRLVFGMATAEEAKIIKQRLKSKAQQLKADYEPDWVTPLTADGFVEGKLPTLEQLFVRPFRVAYDGAWAQYIKAHPPGEKPPPDAVLPQAGVTFDAGDLGLCRLCPHFTELYGHNIYICKQRVLA